MSNSNERGGTNLRFHYLDADSVGVKGHAQTVMKELGITYRLAVPQTLGDQWWFFGCQNIPEPMPKYLSVLPANVKEEDWQ